MAEIHIRAASVTDAAAIVEIVTQPQAVWGTLQLPAQTELSWRKRLESNDPDTSLVLVAEGDGKVVGLAGLFWSRRPRTSHVGDFGVVVHDQYQGQGVGKALTAAALEAADKWLGLIRVELEVFADNEVAIALYRQFGFAPEGRKHMNAFRAGKYVDSLVMGRIRPGIEPEP
ncbi:MAG TPA: GNAT family N-acetyltransferase [Symbiobacteriaceae bacterium]|nr:GNAT family N-acetyltransferase [Symbiobacteriaceae bacterium]